MKKFPRIVCSSILAVAVCAGFLPVTPAHAFQRRITFPVIGPTSFSNDWGAPRVGHTHEGNDIFGTKGQPLVAAVDGVVEWVMSADRGSGLGFSIRDDDGYAYWYLHVNNDTPGTDDGASRGVFAYAPDLYAGNPVVAGQLLGWLGDSGNAETTRPHLHFELHTPDREPTNPFNSLTFARRISTPSIAPPLAGEILPYGQFSGGANIALGDVDIATAGQEIVTGAGPGGGPQVRVYSQAGVLVSQFFAFEKTFRGGIDVAAGDVDADGAAEIIVGSGPGRVSEVRVFSASGVQRSAFIAYTVTNKGGIHVSAADLTGDGRADIVTGPLKGGGPHVRIFNGADNGLHDQFFAYGQGFRGGIDVTAYSATSETPPLIVTTALQGGGPNVRMYNATDHSVYGWFFGREATNRAGLRVAMADVFGSVAPEIVLVPETKGAPVARVFDLAGNELDTHRFLEPWWEGGYDVAAMPGGILAATAKPADTRRRTSVRWAYGPVEVTPDFGNIDVDYGY